jgi:CHAT domain-containing protein
MVRFIQAKFSRTELMSPQVISEVTSSLASVFKTEEDFAALMAFTEKVVNWYHLPGLWFGYFLQLLCRQLQLPWYTYIQTCLIFSDSQMNLNEDLALDSTETAYNTFLKAKAEYEKNTLTDDLKRLLDQLDELIKRRLRVFHQFYSRWSKPVNPADFNPLTENLYYYRTRNLLLSAFPQIDLNDKAKIETDLLSAIDACNSKDLIYYKVIARRTLGHWYLANNQTDASVEQLKLALQDAMTTDLEAEASHLNRLLGYVLMTKMQTQEAANYLYKSFQIDAPNPANYWRSLSARELGHLYRLSLMKPVMLPLKPELSDPMKASFAFYGTGRLLFDAHMIESSQLPISSAIKLQMFRCYTENAIDQAIATDNPTEVLAEIECNSPREIAQLVSEMQAAQDLNLTAESKAELQKTRAVLHQSLGTVPESFEKYLATFPEQYRARHAYLQRRLALERKTGSSQLSNVAVKEVLSISLPNTYFLLFNVGRLSACALINMENGTVKAQRALFSEGQLQAIQQQYRDALKKAGDDDAKRQQAVDALIESYEKLLNPSLEPLVSELEGKQLKIFPRLQMNAVPLHALRLGNKRLIEYCDVSYNQNLSLYLSLHKNPPENPTSPPLVVFNESGTQGFLKGSISAIEREYKIKPEVLIDANWRDFKISKSRSQTKDIYFACHGQYNPKNPTLSFLRTSEKGEVKFSEIFSGTDLSQYRSIVLGACESGVVKADLAAEYVGLPSAFLASGVRYVIGSLWEVNELATAVLFSKYFALLNTGTCSLPHALNEAQRQLMQMTQDKLAEWCEANLPQIAPKLIPQIESLPLIPFGHPLDWAGFFITGDT